MLIVLDRDLVSVATLNNGGQTGDPVTETRNCNELNYTNSRKIYFAVVVFIMAYTSSALRRTPHPHPHPQPPASREVRGQVSFKDPWTQQGGG